jgi:hypothetical protein
VGFNPELAARDNVIINAIMLGLSRPEERARFDEIIEFAELEDFVDLKLKNCFASGGRPTSTGGTWKPRASGPASLNPAFASSRSSSRAPSKRAQGAC